MFLILFSCYYFGIYVIQLPSEIKGKSQSAEGADLGVTTRLRTENTPPYKSWNVNNLIM